MYSNGKSTKLARNILVGEKCSNIDYKYGPYDSIDEAWRVLKPMEVIEKGLTIGIIVNDGIEEYWFKSGTTKTDLIPKRSEINVDVQLNPSSMNPVANRIITNAIQEINNKLNRNTVEVPEDSNLSDILGNDTPQQVTQNAINEKLADKVVALDNRKVLKTGEYEELSQIESGVFYYILEEEDEDEPGSGGDNPEGPGDDPGIIQGLTLKLTSGTVQNRTLILSTGTLNNNTLSVTGDLI